MAKDQTSKFCPVCQKQTLWARPGTNHLLHLLITFFLCGFWLPVWILASIRIGGWRCQICGFKGSIASRLAAPAVCLVLFVGFLALIIGTTSRNESTSRRSVQATPQGPPVRQVHAERQVNTETEESTEGSPPKVFSEGDDVHVGYTSYAVWRSWWSGHLSGNSLLNQPPNAMYLFVELTVRNNDKKARMVPPFKLIDEDGAEYEASANGWAVQGSIGVIESLNPSVSKQGFVIFDVPQGRTYRLKLSGGYWSLQDAYVQLAPKASIEDIREAEQQRQAEERRAEMEQQAELERKAAEELNRAEMERQAAIEEAKWRTWTDSTGTYKVHAKFGGVAFGRVKLIKEDDTTVEVPLEKLCEEDQQWIKDRKP